MMLVCRTAPPPHPSYLLEYSIPHPLSMHQTQANKLSTRITYLVLARVHLVIEIVFLHGIRHKVFLKNNGNTDFRIPNTMMMMKDDVKPTHSNSKHSLMLVLEILTMMTMLMMSSGKTVSMMMTQMMTMMNLPAGHDDDDDDDHALMQ